VPVAAVVRPPTVALDVDDVLLERDGVRLFGVSGRGSNQAETHQRGRRRAAAHPDPIVPTGRRHARASRAVKVFLTRSGIVIGIVEVVAVGRIRIGGQVWMGQVQTVVDDPDAHSGPAVSVPSRHHVEVGSRRGAVLPGVAQMPLVTGPAPRCRRKAGRWARACGTTPGPASAPQNEPRAVCGSDPPPRARLRLSRQTRPRHNCPAP